MSTGLPPTHRLARAALAVVGGLVLVLAATLFAASPLPGLLWSGSLSLVDSVRALW